MAITPLRTLDRTSATFPADTDAFFSGEIQTFADECNAVAAALTLIATQDTSASIVLIGTGPQTFTVSSGKSFAKGMFLMIADNAAPTANWMYGQVMSYSGTSLVMSISLVGGSGTKTAWVISQAPVNTTYAGDHCIIVNTGNGVGSTNNKIRRFTTTQLSVGSAITYADSATLGASFTINSNGVYEVAYSDLHSSGPVMYGISLNTTTPTTGITSIAAAERLGAISGQAGTVEATLSRVVKLSSGDVIRPHTVGALDGASARVMFSIRKIGILA